MKILERISRTSLLPFVLGIAFSPSFGAESGTLRVGIAKVDITPADPTGLANLWGTRFTGIHDKIYARAIFLDNGETTAAIIAVDTVEFADATALVARIAKETGVQTSNIILAPTHNHNAPMVSLQNWSGMSKNGPAAAAFVAQVEKDLVATLKQAKAGLQPARIGVGSGTAEININRDDRTTSGFKTGRNPEGPSDKTVWVIKFETTAGEPIAIFINYAVHATVLGSQNTLLTGELPGFTSRYVEQHYNNKIVALWTSGAAGNQGPIIRGGDPDAENNFKRADVLGQILGEEVVRVADNIKATSARPRILGAEKVVTCPGQKTAQEVSARGEVKFLNADPVSFRLGLLMVDRIALTSVSAEVVAQIYQRLRKESSFTNTIMVTLVDGRIGYIADDASYANPTFEVINSPLKSGCGESTIVNGLLEMMNQY
jgi:neutral ceramidase